MMIWGNGRRQENLLTNVLLCLCALFVVSSGKAWAAPPQLCITSPDGLPYFYPGETISIDYYSSDFGTDPDHASIDWLAFYYQWEGESTLNYITSETILLSGGTKSLTAPATAGLRRLKIIARYEYDGGGFASEAESGLVRIVPAGDSALWLSYPNPPAASDTCRDPLVLAGGSFYVIGWNIECAGLGSETRLKIYYSPDGGSYSLIATDDDPCSGAPIAPWTVPSVTTSNAYIRLDWEYDTGSHISSSTNLYPFSITSEPVNEPPVAILEDDKTALSGERVSMYGCDSYDPEDDPLTYEWTRVDPVRAYYPVDLYASNICSRRFTAPCVNSEITMTYRMSVDDGFHLPATDEMNIIVQPSPDDPDGDCVDSSTDNCPTVANPGQEDGDGDDVGDHCDNCSDTWNEDQDNYDGDRYGDECDPCPYDFDNDGDGDGICADADNCPEKSNAGQEDFDGDFEGDACDCDDGFKGPYEQAADCGYDCPDPCSSSACQPLIINGDSWNKIDVVMIPADDYWHTWPAMANPYYFAAQDAMEMYINSYLADPVMGSATNRTKYNLWYTTGTVADITHSYAAGYRWDEGDAMEDCPGGDIGFIPHVITWRDYSNSGIFSAAAGKAGVMLHESGHALFDLGDEYDDEGSDCTTHYHEADPSSQSNIWRTDNRCEDHSTFPDADCYRFTDCQSYWYKGQSDADPTIMNGSNCPGYGYSICKWGDDAVRQVNDVLGDYSSAFTLSAATAAMSSAESSATSEDKALVVGFQYDGTDLSVTRMRIVNGSTPERKFNRDGMRMTIKDGSGAMLHQFSISNPLYMDFADPVGGGLMEKTTFSEVFPYSAQASVLEVMDVQSETVLGVFDVRPSFHAYCAQNMDDSDCLCEGNYDQDADQDGQDLVTFATAYEKKDFWADLNLDQLVNSDDIKLFAYDYGRDDCGAVVPDCNDLNTCTEDFYEPVSGQCIHRDVVCNDLNSCTTDECNPQTGACVFSLITCEDQDPCTVDSCVDLTANLPAQEGQNYNCVNEPLDCNDNNACTTDFCNEASGECAHKTVLCDDGFDYTVDQCDQVSGCFSVDKTCDDGNPCTDDFVDPSGQCVSVPKTCDDGLYCTTDGCDNKTGNCVNEPVTCDQDGNLCTDEVCTEESLGKCESLAVNCDDKISCTDDYCGQNGCINIPNNQNCYDGDPCTGDICDLKSGCVFNPIPNCKQ
ncbi:MAG: hypothetical protein KQH63_10580 [Desulfobulbaceae bacterium]|nr:hypothetical protein [Desulfobulbaceae bacterium]